MLAQNIVKMLAGDTESCAISALVLPVAGITSSRSKAPGWVGQRFELRLVI